MTHDRTSALGTRASLLADHPGRAGRRPARATGSAARSSWSRSPPRATVSRARRSAALGGTGVFVSALRDALLAGEVDVAVHSLKDLPDRAAPTASRWPPYPPREDPRDVVVARDGLTLGELPGRQPRRHRLAAPGRPAARPRPRFGRGRRSVATSTPGSARSASGEYDAVRARPGRAGPDRPARRGHRGARPAADAPRPRAGCAGGRVPRRRRPRWRPTCATRSTTRAPGPPSTAERAVLATLEGGCSRPDRRPGRGRRGRGRRRAVAAGGRAAPPTAALVGADVRHPAPRPTPRGVGDAAGAARCSPTGAADSDRPSDRPATTAATEVQNA